MNAYRCLPRSATSIRTPTDLEALLSVLNDSLTNGAIEQIDPPPAASSAVAPVNIRNVPMAGPWPDYFEAYFRANDGRRYRLTVETFHGTGGVWEPLEEP